MIPKGWKLVPCEATDEMKAAALKAVDSADYMVTRGYIDDDDLTTSYKAMLSASPNPPQVNEPAPKYDILCLPPQEQPVYFVVESIMGDDKETNDYRFEEGDCPTNFFLKGVETIITNGETDPHGLFEYVRSDKLEFLHKAHDPDLEWRTVLPEAFESNPPQVAPMPSEEEIARAICCPEGCNASGKVGDTCTAMRTQYAIRCAILRLLTPQTQGSKT